MKGPVNLPTKEQVKEFAGYMVKWAKVLGLHDWRIEHSRRKPSAMSDVKVDYEARLATWTIGDFGTHEINSHSLESTALHECLHVLLYDLWYLTNAEASGEILASAEHRIINVLEVLLVPHFTVPMPEALPRPTELVTLTGTA